MNHSIKFFFLIFLFFFSSCVDSEPIVIVDPSVTINCGELESALTDEDVDALASILDPELANFTELDLDNDACPYTRRLEGFVDLLNSSCSQLNVTILCCVCIETFPTLSEIKVLYAVDGVELERTIDLRSPLEEDEPLTVEGIH